MGAGHMLGEPVETESRLRLVRRWRVLLAHDATAATCAPLLHAISAALGNVEVSESSSVDDARVALHIDPGWPQGPRFDVCMVCLDLQPAPLGGVRLAQQIQKMRLPLVLVTRSLRWIPPSASGLSSLPWVAPEATADEVSRAVLEATAAQVLTGGPVAVETDLGLPGEARRHEASARAWHRRGD